MTTAKALLHIMSVRLALYNDGTIHPEKIIAHLTKDLVQRLEKLEPTEGIEIRIFSEDPLHAQYVRTRTGEVLAEIDQSTNT
jgi:DNA-binding HxlR family transcriptional regulator